VIEAQGGVSLIESQTKLPQSTLRKKARAPAGADALDTANIYH